MNLFRIRGIQLAVHITFLPLVGYIAWEAWEVAGGFGLAWSLSYLFMIFTCITLHELGHSFVARSYGVRVPRILLMPIGGMAEFDSVPRRPRSELAIAIAGPAVNVAIVILMSLVVPWPDQWLAGGIPETLTEFAQDIVRFNVIMGLFNLVPVFPMDGGRIFRALLATRLPYVRATGIAAGVAKVLATFFAISMIVFIEPRNYLGAVLFIFIFIAGEMEYRAVKRREREEAQWRQVLASLDGSSSDLSPPPFSLGSRE